MTVCECGYEWGMCYERGIGPHGESEPHYCMKPIGHDGTCECECGAPARRYHRNQEREEQ